MSSVVQTDDPKRSSHILRKRKTQFAYRIKEDIKKNEKVAKENMGQRHCMDGYHLVMSPSMEPTLMTGQKQLFLNSRLTGTLKRGDIIEFYKEDRGHTALDDINPFSSNVILCKRIIGVGGDKIELKNGKVYVNGNVLDEPYAVGDTAPFHQDTYVVPDGCVFVMGDNRENSADSRFWDNPYVSLYRIRGKFVCKFF